MRVAALGDVHGNLHALEAVLADIRRRRVRQVWWLGDLVGYGAFPGEVVARLRARGDPAVLGNYDRKVLDYPARAADWARTKRPEKVHAFRWAHQRLTPGGRAFLASLPEQLVLEVGGLRVVLRHRGPAGEEFVGPGLSRRALAGLIAWAGADVLVVGHTHRPFAAEVDGRWVVNVGAVGRPEGDPRACYALLTLGPRRRVEVEHVRVAYPVEAAAGAILAAGLPPAFAGMLRGGAALDELAPSGADPAALRACRALCLRRAPAELAHARQVARLALRLFDELAELARLPGEAREALACAAWLHDVGWAEGQGGHHKASQRIILAERSLPLDAATRRLVACVARYHRKAMPSRSHALYASLPREGRRQVRLLAGLLRLADGLDRGHRAAVRDLGVRLVPGRLQVTCRVVGGAAPERRAGVEKAELLARALRREIRLVFEPLSSGEE